MLPRAALRCGADDRQALEQLCRYITRPALANECVQTNAAGQVVHKLKTPWRDGTTHPVMSPLEFMQRLAALVPRPRLHLIRFHGVLAPNAKLRALVVPQEVQQEPEPAGQETKRAECEAELRASPPGATELGQPCRPRRARLLKRVFQIDMEHCPNCGGGLKIIAAILEQPVTETILTHLGLQTHCGRRSAPARGLTPQERFALASPNAACKAGHLLARQLVARRCKRPDAAQPRQINNLERIFGVYGTTFTQRQVRSQRDRLRFMARALVYSGDEEQAAAVHAEAVATARSIGDAATLA